LVRLVYDVDGLPVPYKDDLAARIGEPAFQRKAGVGIGQKLNLIRRLGNRAVHDTQPIAARAAVDVLRELHHVVVWSAFRYSTGPASVPTGAVFDPTLAARNAPLSRANVVKLAEKFRTQDEAHARQLKERDDLAAAKDAEITQLREQIKVAQAANTLTDTHDYSEAQTRDLIIDELLREAGWDLTEQRDREFEVTDMPNAQGVGYVDYVLWGGDGLPWRSLRPRRPPWSPPSASSRQSCTPTAWRRRPAAGR